MKPKSLASMKVLINLAGGSFLAAYGASKGGDSISSELVLIWPKPFDTVPCASEEVRQEEVGQ